MSTFVQNRETERAIESVATAMIGQSEIEGVRVSYSEDHTGEPALYVWIKLNNRKARPSGAESIALVKAMLDALRNIGDDRFPYVSFSAPGDEMAEDTRNVA